MSRKSPVLTESDIELLNEVADFAFFEATNEVSSSELPDVETAIEDSKHYPGTNTLRLIDVHCAELIANDNKEDLRRAAVMLVHGQALALRHRAIYQYARRINKREREKEDDEDDEEEDLGSSLLTESVESIRSDVLSFDQFTLKEASVAKLASKLPKEWKVVQINLKRTVDLCWHCRFPKGKQNSLLKETNPPLMITSIACGDDYQLSVQTTDGFSEPEMASVCSEFASILEAHLEVYKRTKEFDKNKYQSSREEVDSRLNSLLTVIEDVWLGCWKVLLLGKPSDEGRLQLLTEMVDRLCTALDLKESDAEAKNLLFSLLDGLHLLNDQQITNGLSKIFSSEKQVRRCLRHLSRLRPQLASISDSSVKRCPVVLVVEGDLQHLPWESLPLLSNQQMTRTPSLSFLVALYESHSRDEKSVTRVGVRREKIFYIVNPSKDLKKTEARLAPAFQKQFGEEQGVVGEWPPMPKISDALSNMDGFMFCGHGSRLATLTAQELETLNIRALPLLFGCKSGQLERLFRCFEPLGTVHSYLIAAAPCTLGFLWSVTDADVDQWTVQFLKEWLVEKKEFVECVARMRPAFKLKINAAALVLYGLPALNVAT